MTTTLRSLAALSALAAAAFTSVAAAQDGGPPPNPCQKPADFAPLDRASPEMVRFQKRLDEYKSCVSQYSKTNGAKGEELSAQGRVYTEAANKAIDDFNAYVTELNVKGKGNSADQSGAARTPPPAPNKY